MPIPGAGPNNNPIVFLDVALQGEPLGRITLLLYQDTCPRTATNFHALCTGTYRDPLTSQPLGFKNSSFHRVIRGFVIQGGAFTVRGGKHGSSIYGAAFEDENFSHSHAEAGTLSMANSGPNSNGSQFFITCAPNPPGMDGKHVVFGKVVEGMDVVRMIENVRVNHEQAPLRTVSIVECGEM